MLRLLERIAPEIEQQRRPKLDKRFAPNPEGFAAVLQEDDLPIVVAGRYDLAVIIDVPELVTGSSPLPSR